MLAKNLLNEINHKIQDSIDVTENFDPSAASMYFTLPLINYKLTAALFFMMGRSKWTGQRWRRKRKQKRWRSRGKRR